MYFRVCTGFSEQLIQITPSQQLCLQTLTCRSFAQMKILTCVLIFLQRVKSFFTHSCIQFKNFGRKIKLSKYNQETQCNSNRKILCAPVINCFEIFLISQKNIHVIVSGHMDMSDVSRDNDKFLKQLFLTILPVARRCSV